MDLEKALSHGYDSIYNVNGVEYVNITPSVYFTCLKQGLLKKIRGIKKHREGVDWFFSLTNNDILTLPDENEVAVIGLFNKCAIDLETLREIKLTYNKNRVLSSFFQDLLYFVRNKNLLISTREGFEICLDRDVKGLPFDINIMNNPFKMVEGLYQ